MKFFSKTFSFCLLFLLLFSLQIYSQDENKTDLFVLHQDVVKIDKTEEYESSIKELFDLWKKHGMELTVKYASRSVDNKYNFLTPLDSYADLDKHDGYWENFAKKAGEETVGNLFKKMDETYVSHKNVIVKRNNELSYWPEDDRLKGQESKYLHFGYFQIKDGHMDEATKLMKEFKELMIKKNNKDGYTVWQSDIGGDLGQVVVVRWAKDAVDFHQASKTRNELVSEELKVLRKKFGAVLESYNNNSGKPMPEFTYSPEK